MKKFYMIGNTHFDPVWLWRWDESMASIRATFRSALDRMKEDDGFIYSFITPPVFEWIKRTEPQMFEEIKQRIEEGRWDIAEGWWIQPDCYSATGESYVRQGLYAQRYLKENFGKQSRVVFNIDSFGHNPQIPQILKKSGIEYYCFVRPEKHHIELESPYFKWEGLDKSTVLAYRAETAYEPDVCETAKKLDYLKGDNHIIVYGVTDHGGAPTKKSIADINASNNMKFSTVEHFFDKVGDTDYIVSGELITGDFGPYSNGVDIKKMNMLAENAVLNAEKSSVIANRCDRNALTDCWKDIMFNQFHDILGGASIKEAYYDARNQYGRAIATAEYIMHTNLQLVTSKIKMPGKNPDNPWNIVVWNMNCADYDGCIEAEVQWLHEFPGYDKSIVLEDAEGNVYKTQIIREKSVIPKFRERFVFKAKIPALGYKAFKVIKTDHDVAIVENEKINPYEIETDLFRFTISKCNGSIEKIYNKKTNQKIDKKIFVPECYEDFGDTWAFDVTGYGKKLGTFRVVDAKIIEDGIHRTKIKLTLKYSNSILYIYYIFYNNENYIDVEYRVNWNEKHETLKFNIDINDDTVRAGVQAGTVLRKAKSEDVPMNRWIKFDDLFFVSDSVFAYNHNENRVGMTILRSCIYGDLRLEDIDFENDYEIMHQGITEGRIRMHLDENIDVCKEAELYTNDCVVIVESNHDGLYEPKSSFLKIDDGISVMAVKFCENSDDIIIRICENYGETRKTKLMFYDKEYFVDMSAFEIKTLKISNGKIKEVNMLEL